MLLLPVAFCTPIHEHECDLNIEGDEGANVIVCYNICDRDCRYTGENSKLRKKKIPSVDMTVTLLRFAVDGSTPSAISTGYDI